MSLRRGEITYHPQHAIKTAPPRAITRPEVERRDVEAEEKEEEGEVRKERSYGGIKERDVDADKGWKCRKTEEE